MHRCSNVKVQLQYPANQTNDYVSSNISNMATCSVPPEKCSRKGIRYYMDINLANGDDKSRFLFRIKNAKRQLASRGSPTLDNREFIGRLLDI